MKAKQIELGGVYVARVSGNFVDVRVLAIDGGGTRPNGRNRPNCYRVKNLTTGRELVFRSATRFRCPHKPRIPETKPALTPIMQQFRDARERHPGMVLLFRMGDFYEAFGTDAVILAKVLEVVLTKRQTWDMASFPHHVLETSLRKLLEAGHRVVICEPVAPGRYKHTGVAQLGARVALHDRPGPI